ncbi:hypothetical protein [Bradyrhizobium elkanii]|jgi:hypothetical protein|uniref:hypothetical protein n=1 Tax=Bradyrhizobium elkanii TaxID=29448 RepID=UPI00039D0918|nr:hypothetical protein [Bradyrhizobium elkanii]
MSRRIDASASMHDCNIVASDGFAGKFPWSGTTVSPPGSKDCQMPRAAAVHDGRALQESRDP